MDTKPTRRDFLKAASVAGSAAVAMSAKSYARVVGANDRIGLGMIGCGDRGRGAHMTGVHPHDKAQNVEFRAVCDVWSVVREEAAKMAKDWYGIEAKQYTNYQELINNPDVDAVMIASCDHQHTRHLEAAAKAGKDAYCEKPLSMDIESLNAAYDAVKESGIIVQIGTQLRSLPSMTGAREVFKTGVLGKVGRIEQMRNDPRPYWYSRVKDAREQDVDWKEFLMYRPMRPYNSVHFTGWYGYREFSDGTIPGFGSHFIDLVHYITGAKFPHSAVGLGGTYTWDDEYKFTCPDHAHVLWTYPEGFMVSYSTNCGNGSGDSFKIFGNEAGMDLVDWNNPFVYTDGSGKPGVKNETTKVEHVEMPDHMLDWLQCLRTRKTPNASMDAGYQHAVAVVMAMMALDSGKRMVFDPEKREVREG